MILSADPTARRREVAVIALVRRKTRDGLCGVLRLQSRAWLQYHDVDRRDDDPVVDTRGAVHHDDDDPVDWDLTFLVSYRPAT